MASRGAWHPLTELGIFWDPTTNAPYYKTSDGKKAFVPPVAAAQYRDDPKMLAWAKSQGATLATDPEGITSGSSVPRGNLLRSRGTWNSQTGQYDQPINWGNLASIGIGTAIAGPALMSAFGGGGGAIAPTAAGSGTAAGTTAAAGGSAMAALSARDWIDLALFGGKTIGDLYGAKKTAEASDRAADAQLTASREALAFLKEQWNKDEANFAPFLQVGHTAANRINTDLGASVAPTRPASVSRVIGPGAPSTMASFGRRDVALPGTPAAQQGYGGMADFATAGARPVGSGQTPAAATASPVIGQPMQFVKMQSPDGEVAAVRAESVDKYLARGARVIG